MVVFHSYVSLPEGKQGFLGGCLVFQWEGLGGQIHDLPGEQTNQAGIPLKQVVPGRMIPTWGSLEDLSHGWPFFNGPEWDCHDDHRIPRSELWTHVVLD